MLKSARKQLSFFRDPVLILILSSAFFLRIWRLGFRDLWYDEAITVLLPDLYSHTWIRHPPLYFFFINIWSRIFGISEFMFRLPSFLFNFSSVILLFKIAKENFNYKVAVFSALFCALSPFQIWYAQEARPYALLGFLALSASYFFFDIVNNKHRNLQWFFYAVLTVLGLYTHTLYSVFFLTQLCLFAFFLHEPAQKSNLRYCIFSIFILSIPRLFSLFSEYLAVTRGFWVPKPTLLSLLVTVENFFLGYGASVTLYRICSMFLFIFLACLLLRRSRTEGKNTIFSFILFTAPLLLVFLYSRFFLSIYLDRVLIYSSYFFYICVAIGLNNIRLRMARIFFTAILIAFQIYGIKAYINDEMPTNMMEHHMGVSLKKPYKGAVNFVNDHLREGDILAFSATSLIPIFACHGPKGAYAYDKLKFFYHPDVPSDISRETFYIDKRHIPLFKIADLPARRIWLIAGDWERTGDINNDRNSLEVKRFMDKNFILCKEKKIDSLSVNIYVKRGESGNEKEGHDC